MKKSLFIALVLIVLLGVVSPVSADSGNNNCPDSAMEGHFCAQSPGKVITDPETGEVVTGVMAKEWSMPSCSYLYAYRKASEHDKDGWNLLFTENCDIQPTPVPTQQPTQPVVEPTQQPSTETNEQTSATETIVGCPDPDCVCVEIGPDTQSFITKLFERFFDLAERFLDIWAKK